jgi:Glucose / Sorbosone dehydrogenase
MFAIITSVGHVYACVQVLDIAPNVKFGGELGLLGLAFHPNFQVNGAFYVNYIASYAATIISRFTYGADAAATAATEVIMLTWPQVTLLCSKNIY